VSGRILLGAVEEEVYEEELIHTSYLLVDYIKVEIEIKVDIQKIQNVRQPSSRNHIDWEWG
jgi:hypothetical protein